MSVTKTNKTTELWPGNFTAKNPPRRSFHLVVTKLWLGRRGSIVTTWRIFKQHTQKMAPQVYCFMKTRAKLPGIFQLIRQQLYWCHSGTLSIKRQNCVASRLINHVTTASLQGPINITSWILPQKCTSILNMFFITWGEAGVLKQRKNRKLKYIRVIEGCLELLG